MLSAEEHYVDTHMTFLIPVIHVAIIIILASFNRHAILIAVIIIINKI